VREVPPEVAMHLLRFHRLRALPDVILMRWGLLQLLGVLIATLLLLVLVSPFLAPAFMGLVLIMAEVTRATLLGFGQILDRDAYDALSLLYAIATLIATWAFRRHYEMMLLAVIIVDGAVLFSCGLGALIYTWYLEHV
jgi:hypothetical protein